MRYKLPIVLLIAAACAASPRTTTEQERQVALQTLTHVETAVLAMHALGNLAPEQLALAMQQIAGLREQVINSAEVPVDWALVFQQITNLAIQWAVESK